MKSIQHVIIPACLILLISIQSNAQQANTIIGDSSAYNPEKFDSLMIEALPYREMNNIYTLFPGVNSYEKTIHIRGGEYQETGYLLNGFSIYDPVTGSKLTDFNYRSLRSIELYSGYSPVSLQSSTAGFFSHELKTGGGDFHVALEYVTDNFLFRSKEDLFDREKTLGTYSYGYDETSLSLSGTIPEFEKYAKFYGNINYVYMLDRNPEYNDGFDFGRIGDGLQVNPSQNDSILLKWPAGPQPGRKYQRYSYTGNLSLQYDAFKLNLTGLYSSVNSDVYSSDNFYNIRNFMVNTRYGVYEGSNGLFSLKFDHELSSNADYSISAAYMFNDYEITDPFLKDDYWNYGDSVANAEVGVVWERNQKDYENSRYGRYWHPSSYNIFGYSFSKEGAVLTNHKKESKSSIDLKAHFNWRFNKNIKSTFGMDYKSYTLRKWEVYNQTSLARSLFYRLDFDPTLTEDEAKQALLYENGVNNYGYDIYGETEADDGLNAPKQPTFTGFYFDNTITEGDLRLNLGLRYDYIDPDMQLFADPTRPESVIGTVWSYGNITEENLVDAEVIKEFSPRVGIQYIYEKNTAISAQYGRYVFVDLIDKYTGIHRTAYQISSRFTFTNKFSISEIKPVINEKIEFSANHLFNNLFEFGGKVFYSNLQGQTSTKLVNTNNDLSPYGDYIAYESERNTIIKGLELNASLNNYKGFSSKVYFTLTDTEAEYIGSEDTLKGTPERQNNYYITAYLNYSPQFDNDLLNNFNISSVITYKSGFPFYQTASTTNQQPVEEEMESGLRIDLKVSKTFNIYDRLDGTIFLEIYNLLDTKTPENVYNNTGSPESDGYIDDPALGGVLIDKYGDIYEDIYRSLNINSNGYYEPPRQIRLGIRLEY